MSLWTINEKGDIDLSFHPGQWHAWNSTSRFPFVIAGTQGGKTSFGPWWLLREIYDSEIGRGSGDYLAVTASYDLFKLKMLPELRTVFESVQNVGRYWAGDKVLELRDPESGEFLATRSDDAMWGRIILRSAQSGGGLESATAKGAWLDECGQDDFTLEDWEAVQRRLSLAEGRALGTTTPYNLGWLKSEVYDPWAEGDADFDVISFASIQNPAFPKREFERVKRRMQDWRFGMFYEGRFTRPAGLIYACFTDDMLCDPFDIPNDWPRYVGVDFGGANNALLWAAENPQTEQIVIYDEWLGGGMTSADYADRAHRNLPDGCEFLAWGGAHSEGQARRDWGAAGFWIDEPVVSDVEQGIDRVTELIKGNRLRVFRTLRGFRDEIGSYKRKLNDAGEPLEDIENKRQFHRMDALRYMAVGIIEQAGPWAVLI